MRESFCEKIVNNSLGRVNKFSLVMRQQLFLILTKFSKKYFFRGGSELPGGEKFFDLFDDAGDLPKASSSLVAARE
jgi:hypothetical protein